MNRAAKIALAIILVCLVGCLEQWANNDQHAPTNPGATWGVPE